MHGKTNQNSSSHGPTQETSAGSSTATSPHVPQLQAPNDPIENHKDEDVSNSDLTPSQGAKLQRSYVWDHFKVYEKKETVKDKDGNDTVVVTNRAKCIYCPRGQLGDYSVNSASNGTSGMLRHINKYCRYYPPNVEKKQKVLVGDKTQGNKLTAVGYNQEDYLEACVEMVVIDELPFSFVERPGFNRLCTRVYPLFNIPSRRKLVREFLAMYDKQKKELMKNLKMHRVCLTTDTWTSIQNVNYMVLTAHFIDSDWQMHKRVLNFCVIPNHQGPTIGRLIESCLLDWKIEKVLTITVDNAAANNSALEWIRSKMNNWNPCHAVLGGKYLHVRCTAHIANLVVGSGLKRLNKSVLAIRNFFKYVRSSPNRLDIFKKAVEKEKLTSKGLVCMDVPTRWNSTYLMLEAALKFKKAFTRLGDDEETKCQFLGYFTEPEEEYDEDGNLVPSKSKRSRVGPPTDDDWAKAEVFVDLLKVFYDVTMRVSASLHPTVHTTFHDVVTMEQNINSMFVMPEFATGSETEKVLSDMAAHMRTKFLKYYGSFHELNHLVVIGLLMDPRFNLRNISYLLREEGLDEIEVQNRSKQLKEVLMSLYDEYAPSFDGGRHVKKDGSPTSSSSSVTSSDSKGNVKIGRGKLLQDWRKVVEESEEAVVAHEVDQYLSDPLEYTEDDEECFDILCWWKINGSMYPVLANIAKDLLAIQTSTVASESAFSTRGRVIDAFRSSLTPKTVEALMCMQSWLRGDDIGSLEDEPSIEEYEFYEKVESEYSSGALGRNTSLPLKPKAKTKVGFVIDV